MCKPSWARDKAVSQGDRPKVRGVIKELYIANHDQAALGSIWNAQQ